MLTYSVTGYDIATGAVVDTYRTLGAVVAADTTAFIGRVRSITIGGGGNVAQDIQVSVRLVRTDNTAAGTPASTPIPTKLDPNTLASNMTTGIDYSGGEPTALEGTNLWEDGFNARGSIIKEWAPGKGPIFGKNQTLVLQATPGTANAVTLVFAIEWDEGP